MVSAAAFTIGGLVSSRNALLALQIGDVMVAVVRHVVVPHLLVGPELVSQRENRPEEHEK